MCVNAGAAECSDCPTGWLCLEGEELQLCPEDITAWGAQWRTSSPALQAHTALKQDKTK